VLKQRLTYLLQDKEKTATTEERARKWLANEAADPKTVTKAGTFWSVLYYQMLLYILVI
jgi:hypothetical protein